MHFEKYDSLCFYTGLPVDGNVGEMKQIWQRACDSSPKPMTILASLFRTQEDVERLDQRLKVSREEKTLGIFLVKYRRDLVKGQDDHDSLKPYTDFIIDVCTFFLFSTYIYLVCTYFLFCILVLHFITNV